MAVPRIVRELKRDVLGRVELVELDGALAVRRVACGGRVPGARAIAGLLLRRERRALARLEGMPAVPRLADARWNAGVADGEASTRSWLEGEPLSRTPTLPENFFELLAELVRAMHARGVCHNDLHKEQNVLVGPDGRPALVDFQLASAHRVGSWLWRSRASEDLRHVEKHRRRYMQVGRGPRGKELDLAATPRPPRSAIAWTWRRAVKPLYNWTTRRVLRWRDFEERRPSSGPWPRWTPPA